LTVAALLGLLLERLTKRCHRESVELRLAMHEQKQRSQRSAVEEDQAVAA
jgi:hypothetical protein